MKPTRAVAAALFFTACATLFFQACGSSSSTGPSAVGVTLVGTVEGGAVASAAANPSAAATQTITVSVQGQPSMTTTVGADGTFTLRGLPTGEFVLVFSSGGTTLGSLTFTGVASNQEITVTVAISGTTVSLVNEQRNGIGHGDAEIEGQVEAVLSANPTGDSRFVVRGATIVVRPGVTAIREGNKARSVADIVLGQRVHVKGTYLPPEATGQPLLAAEIKLQGVDDSTNPPSPPTKTCVAGSKEEVEGLITFTSSSSVTVKQTGKGDYLCQATTSTKIRKGNKTLTMADLKTGNRVHVKGTAQGLQGAACQVAASEIQLQN